MNRYLPLALLASTSQFAAGCSSADDDATPNAWQGHTYLLSIPETSWIEPDPRIGGEIGLYVPEFLIRVDASSDPSISATVGTSWGGVQDMCGVTQKVLGSSAYPMGTLSAHTYRVHIRQEDRQVTVNTDVWNLEMKDVLPNESTPNATGTFSATLDAREIYPLFYQIPGRTPETVCAALGQWGVACEPCPKDNEVFCLTIEAVDLGAVESTASLSTVAQGDLDASCADTQ